MGVWVFKSLKASFASSFLEPFSCWTNKAKEDCAREIFLRLQFSCKECWCASSFWRKFLFFSLFLIYFKLGKSGPFERRLFGIFCCSNLVSFPVIIAISFLEIPTSSSSQLARAQMFCEKLTPYSGSLNGCFAFSLRGRREHRLWSSYLACPW